MLRWSRRPPASAADDGAIEIENLTKVFPRGDERPVLDGVSIRVESGDIAAVIGPSGAGKSTLARCLNLLERPTSGRVTVGGLTLNSLGERDLNHARRQIGTIFQASSLVARQSARENVALPLKFAGWSRAERRARAEELLALVGLDGYGRSYPHQLSGGQRQRVGIARALALKPKILLSDEATSGLDPATTASTLELMRDLRDQLGLTILLITHEMEVVREIAVSAILLEAGRVVEAGPVTALVRDARSRLGRGLLAPRPESPAPAGETRWEVTYAAADVRLDWLQYLGERLDARISILGGVMETIDGRPAGRATVAVGDPSADVGALLAPVGLHAERLDGSRAAEEPVVNLGEAA